jgi:hypothetical protein
MADIILELYNLFVPPLFRASQLFLTKTTTSKYLTETIDCLYCCQRVRSLAGHHEDVAQLLEVRPILLGATHALAPQNARKYDKPTIIPSTESLTRENKLHTRTS